MLVIIVGPMKQRFSFHQAKVCSRSKWLTAACSRHRIEGQPPTKSLEVYLPDCDVEVIHEYWEWVYSGTISFRRCTSKSEQKAKSTEYTLLVNFYKLGCSVKLEDVQLRNVATLELSKSLQAWNVAPDQNLFAVVWSIPPRGDGLRNLLLDFMVARANRSQIGAMLLLYPSAFVQGLALAALLKVPYDSWPPATANGPRYLKPEQPEVNTA
jgi:hypothetical protein